MAYLHRKMREQLTKDSTVLAKVMQETHDKREVELKQLRAENNKITRYFSDAGKKPKHAGDSQAQKHLYENYCMHRQCLHCAVGKKLIATESNPAVKEQC